MKNPKKVFRLEANFSQFISGSKIFQQVQAENAKLRTENKRLRQDKLELLTELRELKEGIKRQASSILTILDGTMYRKD